MINDQPLPQTGGIKNSEFIYQHQLILLKKVSERTNDVAVHTRREHITLQMYIHNNNLMMIKTRAFWNASSYKLRASVK